MNRYKFGIRKTIFALVMSLAICVSFMPINAADAYAASFSTSGSVSGLKVTKTTSKSVTLAWKSYKGAKGYQIYKARKKNGKYEKIKSTWGTSYKRSGLTTNLTCYYKVRAYYKKSNGSYGYSKFSTAVAGTPKNTGSSSSSSTAAVQGLKVTGTTYNSVSLAWTKVSGTSGYQIYKATSKNGKYTKIKTTGYNSYKRTSLTTNLTCYYKVRAYKKSSSGKYTYGKFSTVVAGTPELYTPSVTVTGSSSSVKTSWGAVSGATGYQVYRATSASGSYSNIKTTSEASYTDSSITKGKTYYYKVRAYRTVKGSNKYGSYSSVKAGCTGVAQVTGVQAKVASDGIQLSWTTVSGASGYDIQRATGSASGKYTSVGSSTSASFKDSNVANGLTYFYKIRGYKTVDGNKIYGEFSSNQRSRSAVVAGAVEWLGCREGNGSNKPIVTMYNKNMGTNFSYTTPWCAMFVSAVAIKTGTTDIIIRGSYCPSIINSYKAGKAKKYSYGSGSKYVPKPGDVIFFDWNRNNVPDHTGLVATVKGNQITTIEGNMSSSVVNGKTLKECVGYRTFSVGYSMVQGYGLPNYDEGAGILYTGESSTAVGCGELEAAGIEPEPVGYSELGEEYEFVEDKVIDSVGTSDGTSEYDKMVYIINKVKANSKAEEAECAESQYYAAFLYKLCQEAGIDASILTGEDENGITFAWIESYLDGKWYTIDATQENCVPVEFTPEVTDAR